MKLHANARTCLHGRRLLVERVTRRGWTRRQAAADRQLTRVAGALRHGANPGAAPSFPRLARMRAYRSFERLNALANRSWRRAGLAACA